MYEYVTVFYRKRNMCVLYSNAIEIIRIDRDTRCFDIIKMKQNNRMKLFSYKKSFLNAYNIIYVEIDKVLEDKPSICSCLLIFLLKYFPSTNVPVITVLLIHCISFFYC